ncbi:MAG: hypothetical protein LBS45_00810 [Synergistaceae bacterium]|jgi:hypothetical protein|nr:hypothetical protein [Synergistaceae bacterium]
MIFPGRNRSSRSFILLESLASLSVLSMIVTGVVVGAIAIMETGNYVADVAAAQDRADQIFSLLKMPADLCGYGLPKSAPLYRQAFAQAGIKEPFNWDGVISVMDNKIINNVFRKNGVCRIVYGIPTGACLMRSSVISDDQVRISAKVIGKSEGGKVMLDRLDPVKSPDRPRSVKNWLLFGSALPQACPMWLSGDMEVSFIGKKLNLVWNKTAFPDAPINIHKHDNLFYMGAIEFGADKTSKGEDIFYINNLRGGGRQPRELGIIDARFELHPGRKILRVLLLVRGDRRYEEIKTKDVPAGWPAEYASDIPNEARHYRLFAFAESFELKNL